MYLQKLGLSISKNTYVIIRMSSECFAQPVLQVPDNEWKRNRDGKRLSGKKELQGRCRAVSGFLNPL